MKLVSALMGCAALCGVALSTGTASAMPIAVPTQASPIANVEQAAYVCNEWGHCWHHRYGGYHHPHYWRWHHWYRWQAYDGGWGGGGYGWHHWHRHYGDWGYGWHHWHHWDQW